MKYQGARTAAKPRGKVSKRIDYNVAMIWRQKRGLWKLEEVYGCSQRGHDEGGTCGVPWEQLTERIEVITPLCHKVSPKLFNNKNKKTNRVCDQNEL